MDPAAGDYGVPMRAVTEEHSTKASYERNPAPVVRGFSSCGPAAYASVKLRVTAGSTGMPGPVVVETTIFFR